MVDFVEQNWSECIKHFKNPILWKYLVIGLYNSDDKRISKGFCTDIDNVPSGFTGCLSWATDEYGIEDYDFDDYYWSARENYDGDDDISDDDDVPYYWSHFYMDKRAEYYTFNKIWDKIEMYQPTRRCHWWNPTFSWQLAQLVFPQDQWIIISNEHHTSVINQNKQYFELLYDIKYPMFPGKDGNEIIIDLDLELELDNLTITVKSNSTEIHNIVNLYEKPEDCEWLRFPKNLSTSYDEQLNQMIIDIDEQHHIVQF